MEFIFQCYLEFIEDIINTTIANSQHIIQSIFGADFEGRTEFS